MSHRALIDIRERLLRWHRDNRRDLPWRRTRDPYAVWVAETMLQQTQVATVLPYYTRFLKAFPTVHALDRAALEKVLTLWSGLGYYRRAENLKAAARMIVREHGGRIPRDWDELLALPGVGPYTAGAVLSIAFNLSFPAVDGNAARVLGRVFTITKDKDLREIAGRLARCRRPGFLNQGLMELGATLCAPRNPRCPECPLANACAAYSVGRPPAARLVAKKPQARRVAWPLVVIRNNGKILLRRRPAGEILGRMWEIPGGEAKPREAQRAALMRHLDGLGRNIEGISAIGEVRHSITDRRIRALVFTGELRADAALPDANWTWLSPGALRRRPLSSLTRKALRLAGRR